MRIIISVFKITFGEFYPSWGINKTDCIFYDPEQAIAALPNAARPGSGRKVRLRLASGQHYVDAIEGRDKVLSS